MASPQFGRKKSHSIDDILILPDKGIRSTKGVGGVIARLFRQILIDLNIGTTFYGSLITAYINDPINHIPDNRKDRSSIVGNFSKEFSKPFMTWKKFVEGLRVLQFEGEVTITITGKSRRFDGVSSHSTKFNLGELDDFSNETNEYIE